MRAATKPATRVAQRTAPRPDPDQDRDGIPVPRDLCPDKPETINHFKDNDGCPDRSPVTVHAGKIVLEEPIYFRTATDVIMPRSLEPLKVLANTLKARNDLQLVEIQGHSDNRGSDLFNQTLTQKRASAIRRHLIKLGVAPTRLKARGYGESRPLCREQNFECWSRNRRTEFIILKRSTAAVGIRKEL
jgi:outer membrane protein OmpA-like peptidoglycan-associated protein